MKNISNEARCTNANGRDITTEIREPFGNGMDQGREAVAIRCVSFRAHISKRALFAHFLHTWTESRRTLRKTRVIYSLRALHGAVKGTVEHCTQFDAPQPAFDSAPIGITWANVLSFLARPARAKFYLSAAKTQTASCFASKGLQNHG
jgi:hypothetical protein